MILWSCVPLFIPVIFLKAGIKKVQVLKARL